LFLPPSLRRFPDECVDIVRLRAADVAKVVEEAKREQEQGVLRMQAQGGQQPLGDVEALGADLEQSGWRRGTGCCWPSERLGGCKTCWQGQGRG
jgi:hypothetical protein